MQNQTDRVRDAFYGHTSFMMSNSLGKKVVPDYAVIRDRSGVVRDPIGYLRTRNYNLVDPYELDKQELAMARFSPRAYNTEGYEDYVTDAISEYQK